MWFFFLVSRVNDLEEEVRELQLSQSEQEESEQRRSREMEMLARLEREKQLEVENYAIRYLWGLQNKIGQVGCLKQ